MRCLGHIDAAAAVPRVEYSLAARVWGARSPANEASARLMGELGIVEEGPMAGFDRSLDPGAGVEDR
ncbi:hypothetical protein GCM10009560_13090 [Nonomuraea longicatena]|uniref:Uncharacterized protein n=1 Tax=Nonomuraea longicatena TaxID=83682 RepID=A0ABN1NUN7_9ACTN